MHIGSAPLRSRLDAHQGRPELRRPFHESPPYLRDLVGKHAVVYRVTADGEVLIVRVLHAAMLPSEFVLLLETPWGFVTQDEVR